MRKQGFEIFTVNMGTGDLSPLASDSNHTYNVITDSDDVRIATRIGDSLCKAYPLQP
ncbi:unnamed protein product [Cylicostephanus goldi]|uniref:Uncharacterized protein n=1 Tax=Cylicostephanus goldi TaxID=71465 RepID=A0A3P6SA20_CYLGO|nr:unnamed protein product [Cylicostephanus goldi]